MSLYDKRLTNIFSTCIANDRLHARFLNSISLMEHCGARKIFRFQGYGKHDTMVMRHAAEEARHAFYFRQLTARLEVSPPDGYADHELLAARDSRNYLKRLDLVTCRFLKARGWSGVEMRNQAYLWTTFVIELRAKNIYVLYEGLLKRAQSKISVRPIIAEEDRHLREMEKQLQSSYGNQFMYYLSELLASEEKIFNKWVLALETQVIARPL